MVATPTISVVDQADNTGATATISGADAGTNNVVYTASVDGDLGATSTTWTSGGSRTGDGTVDVNTVTAGYYWMYATSTDGTNTAASTPVYVRVTTGSESTHKDTCDAVLARLQSLTMSGLSSANIKLVKLPAEMPSSDTLPCIHVGPQGRETMDARAGTNVKDDTGYPVLVVIFCADNAQDRTANLNRNLKWREQVAKSLQNQPLAGTQLFRCEVEPLEIWPPSAVRNANLFVSGFTVRCFARETRGLT